MALPTELNISILRNTDNFLEFTIKDSNNKAIDITNDTIEFIAKDGYSGPDRIPLISNGFGDHKAPSSGVTEFFIDNEKIDEEVSPGSETVWLYEVRRKYGDPVKEYVHYQGKLTIKPSVR